METTTTTMITVKATIEAPVAKVWDGWNNPEHITQWCSANDEWHTPWAKNDLRVGGSFTSRMEARDGSMGFDFGGVYDAVNLQQYIAYTMGDGRKVNIKFIANGNSTEVIESFDPETENPREMQQAGWQAILDNFKKYIETH